MGKTKTNKLYKDIAAICDYLEYDEKNHFEENGCPQRHIWHNIKRLKQWLKYK